MIFWACGHILHNNRKQKAGKFSLQLFKFGTGFYSCKFVIMHCTIHIIYTFFRSIHYNVCIYYAFSKFHLYRKLEQRLNISKLLNFHHVEMSWRCCSTIIRKKTRVWRTAFKVSSITVAHVGDDPTSNKSTWMSISIQTAFWLASSKEEYLSHIINEFV